MKKATLFSIIILMLVSFSIPSHASFRVHPAPSSMSFNASQASNDKEDTKAHKKKTGVFGIVSISAGVIGCVMSVGILAIILGVGAAVFGIIGMSKKKKLKGLAIAGLILGIIAIVGGILIL